MKDTERLLERIKRLDDRLFEQLQPVLTDEQMPMLARVRLARERTRCLAQQMIPMTGPAVDLSEIVLALDLDAELLAEVDPVIALYEQRLTAGMREASEAASRMYLDMFDAFEALGYGEMTEEQLTDPEAMTKMMEDVRQIWSAIGGAISESVAKIAELNGKTYRRVAALLPPDTARDLRGRYYSRAYPELGSMLALDKQEWFGRMIERDDLSDEQREALATTIDGCRWRLDRMVDDAAKLIEAHRAASSPFDFDVESMQDYHQQLAEAQTEARELMAATMGTIKEIIGQDPAPGVIEEAQQKALALAGVDFVVTPEAGQDAPADAKDAEDRARRRDRRIDRWIPGPISEREIARYATTLELEADVRSELLELHAEYVRQFDALDAIAELPEANQSLWKYDPATGTAQPPTVEAVEQVYRLRRRAIDEITRLERALFDNLQALVSEERAPTVTRMQALRQRQTYNPIAAGMYGYGYGRSGEADVDVVKLVEDHTLEADTLRQIDPILVEYDGHATDLFRQRLDARFAFQLASETWRTEAHALQNDASAAMEFALRYQEIVGGASKKLGEASKRVATLNRQTVEALVETLPEADGASFRRAYDHEAFPSVYKDPVSVDHHLASALKLGDLTDEQREQLDGLAEAYRPEYERLSQAMITFVGDDQMDFMSFDMAERQKFQEKQEQLQKLRFDRNELCYRAINRLQAVLTPEQIKRIGGLPEIKEDRGFPIW